MTDYSFSLAAAAIVLMLRDILLIYEQSERG